MPISKNTLLSKDHKQKLHENFGKSRKFELIFDFPERDFKARGWFTHTMRVIWSRTFATDNNPCPQNQEHKMIRNARLSKTNSLTRKTFINSQNDKNTKSHILQEHLEIHKIDGKGH